MVRSPKQRERGTGAHWLRVGCKKGTSSLLPGRACGRRRPKSRPHGSFSSRLATAAAAAALVLPRRRFAVPSSQLLRFCVCECESVCVRPSVRPTSPGESGPPARLPLRWMLLSVLLLAVDVSRWSWRVWATSSTTPRTWSVMAPSPSSSRAGRKK